VIWLAVAVVIAAALTAILVALKGFRA